MRELSFHTRVIVIAVGLSEEQIHLVHYGFSCFDSVALMHVESRCVMPQSVDLQCAEYHYCLMVIDTSDDVFLADIPPQRVCIYSIGQAECSVIGAIEQIKRFARMTHSRNVNINSASFLPQVSARRVMTRSVSPCVNTSFSTCRGNFDNHQQTT